jgi:hypothetical protein
MSDIGPESTLLGYSAFALCAGTNAKGRFCKARTNLCCGSIEPLSADSGEVRHACRKAGRARDIACQEVRTLLNEAIAASEEGSAATLPPDTCIGPDRHLGVSRELRAAPRGHSHANAFPAWSLRRH